jgi:AcrR family transcriptional regulator
METTTRTLQKNKTVESIQDAAKKSFRKRGFHKTRMQEIAKLAGISKGTLYLYFKNKDDLYLSICFPTLKYINKIYQKFLKELENGKYKKGNKFIMNLMKIHYDIYDNNKDAMKIIQEYQVSDHYVSLPAKTRLAIKTHAKNNFSVLRDIIRKASELKLISKTDPIVLSDVIWSLFLGVVQVEGSKLRDTKKDHLFETLKYSFSLFETGICKK